VLDSYSLLFHPTLPAEETNDWGYPLYFANSVGRLLAPKAGYALLRLHTGPHSLDHVKAFFAHTSQLLRSRGWDKLLVDQRAGHFFTTADQAWLEDYWLARQQREGRALYGALLLTPEAFADLTYKAREQAAQVSTLTYRPFEDQATAVAWLRLPG
jgi:hypothetical protein